jgi:hypothetical protein
LKKGARILKKTYLYIHFFSKGYAFLKLHKIGIIHKNAQISFYLLFYAAYKNYIVLRLKYFMVYLSNTHLKTIFSQKDDPFTNGIQLLKTYGRFSQNFSLRNRLILYLLL